jgi:hypothetical protein
MSTIFVTNLNDSGVGSLRAALLAANADRSGSPIEIKFSVAGTINLESALPRITNSMLIDATSAPGYVIGGAPAVTLNFNNFTGLDFALGSNGSKLIGLALGNSSSHGISLHGSNITLDKNYIGLTANGGDLGNDGDGIFITALSVGNYIGLNDSQISGVIGNVISFNNGNGISIHGSSGNILVANRIGTSADGNTAHGNFLAGIHITDGATNNTIGGTVYVDAATGQVNNPTGDKGTVPGVFVVPPLGNLISGNSGDGVLIDTQSQNNVLNGNFIGTNANGDSALGNGRDGVHILGADNNSLIGCEFVDQPFVYYNVVSGNAWNGLHITDSDNVIVQANFFGIGADNASLVGNGRNGILVDGNSQDTTVGGVIPLGNVSGGNGQNGIYVTDVASGFTTFNTFGGLFAFQGAAPNGDNGLLIDSTGGNQLVRTNVFSGNLGNGIRLAGDASGITIDPNIVGMNTVGNAALPNFQDGLSISNTAHNITVGGYTQSVIPQNAFSGNLGYGIALYGNVYDINIFNSAVGLDVLKAAAVGNGAGGILYASSGSGNMIGGAQSPDPLKPIANYIAGNNGDGLIMLYGTSDATVMNNIFGMDRFGLPVVPNAGQALALNGAFGNNVIGNIGGNAGDIQAGLQPQSPYAQIESLYVGYYGRAADPEGMDYWMGEALAGLLEGESLTSIMESISYAFATSSENAPYSALATQTLNPANQQQVDLANAFIEQTYINLFNRNPDAAGQQYWVNQLFAGNIPFGDIVYTIASSAAQTDHSVLWNKLNAATYFTENLSSAGITDPSGSAMQDAVAGVISLSTAYASRAGTDIYSGISIDGRTQNSIFTETFITGVRGDYDGNVVLTGDQVILNSGGNTQAILYRGPIDDTAMGRVYALNPSFDNQTVVSSTFYGPNTSVFDRTIPIGEVRAVGSYVIAEDTGVRNHGMLYEGTIDGTNGTWTQIDVPSSLVGGQSVVDTILHSTMGDFAVGNYDLDVPLSGNGFIYNIRTGEYTIMDAAFGGTDQLTTIYGIWQNEQGGTQYTIAGGSKHGIGLNQAYVANYDSVTGIIDRIKYYDYDNQPGLISHFDGITAVPGGFNLMTIGTFGSALATITVNPDGSFSDAQWSLSNIDGADIVTGNTVFQNYVMGIYGLDNVSGTNSYSEMVDQSIVNEFGGLIMPVGAPNYSYSTSVINGIGSMVVGSKAVGNVLGGSIGNDIFVGTSSRVEGDTIYTGGGGDMMVLATDRIASTRIELFAGNSTSDLVQPLPGSPQTAIFGSVVSIDDVPQLGWWGQATGQRGGAVSNVFTNLGFGTGTSQDVTTIHNFDIGRAGDPGDSIDFSLSSYSHLLRDLTPSDGGPRLGNAILSNTVSLGGTITVSNANVIVMDASQTFSSASDLSAQLASSATAIRFASTQTNQYNHYLIAYQDTGGYTRIADMNIQSDTAFSATNQGDTLALSDLVRIGSVGVNELTASNIQFVL